MYGMDGKGYAPAPNNAMKNNNAMIDSWARWDMSGRVGAVM